MHKIDIQTARGLCLSNIYYVSQSVSRETHKNTVSRETVTRAFFRSCAYCGLQ